MIIRPVLRPRRDQAGWVDHEWVAWLGPRAWPRRGLTAMIFRGSIARRLIWLSTLRRGGRPPTTQDSLPAAGPALPGGIRTRRVPAKGFKFEAFLLSW